MEQLLPCGAYSRVQSMNTVHLICLQSSIDVTNSLQSNGGCLNSWHFESTLHLVLAATG